MILHRAKNGARRLPSEKSLANLAPPWKPGQSGNPKGRPKKKTFEELVEEELSAELKGTDGMIGREALAKHFARKLFKDKDAFAHYIKRAWPEVSRHEVSADIDMNAEMQIAADELRRILEGDR